MNIARALMAGLRLMRQPQHRATAMRMWKVYSRPLQTFHRYLTKSGSYPYDVVVKIGGRKVTLRTYSSHDLDTVNQIFCRRDYPARPSDRIFVDFGANIGVATRYFAEVSDEPVVYSFEPVAANQTKLAANTEGQPGRLIVSDSAVSDFDGSAVFVTEDTGRYGHLDDGSGTSGTTVTVRNAAAIIDEILQDHGRIDVLKVDIEGNEERVLRALRADQLKAIGRIFAEYQGDFIPAGFVARRWGFVTQYERH